MRVASLFRIKSQTQHLHSVEVIPGKLLSHEIDFLRANAVLAGHAAAQCDAFIQNVISSLQCAFNLIGIAFIIQDQRMNIPVAGMKYIWNS